MIPETPIEKLSRLQEMQRNLTEQRVGVVASIEHVNTRIGELIMERENLLHRLSKMDVTLAGLPQQIDAMEPLCADHRKRRANAELIEEIRRTHEQLKKLQDKLAE